MSNEIDFPDRDLFSPITDDGQTLNGSNCDPGTNLNALQKWGNENGIGATAPVVTDEQWRELLESRRFSFDKVPEKPVPVFKIGNHVIATKGNITNIQGQAKGGKSAILGAMIAASLDNIFGLSYLGICSDGEPGAILHFDTEQSRYDHDALIRRALKRAGLETQPKDLHSYTVADLTLTQRVEAVFGKMEELAKVGRLKAVFLDGVADLLSDPNDPQEAFAMVDRIHQAAIRYDTVIVCNIHENPSGAESGKTRGHLGSQLVRKAETNLRLEKDKAGVTTVSSELSRNCHLPKEHGPRFAWSAEAGMHVDVPAAGEAKRDAKTDDLKRQAAAVFFDAPQLSHARILEQLVKNEPVKLGGARHRFDAMREAGILTQNSDGKWIIAP